jgi:hypothetical protein
MGGVTMAMAMESSNMGNLASAGRMAACLESISSRNGSDTAAIGRCNNVHVELSRFEFYYGAGLQFYALVVLSIIITIICLLCECHSYCLCDCFSSCFLKRYVNVSNERKRRKIMDGSWKFNEFGLLNI